MILRGAADFEEGDKFLVAAGTAPVGQTLAVD